MLDIFFRGGPLMYPILFCSIIGWAIFMERFVAYVQIRRELLRLRTKVSDLLSNNRPEDALELCLQGRSPLARILVVVLKNRGASRAHLKSLAEEVGEREAVFLQRYLGLLATIANVSPLLGLLGTVLGMINAFNVIAVEGVGTPATLGGGISEALITTAAGLSVAVPMLLVHRYLSARSDRLTLELEEASMKIVDQVEG
ncbi:MotA/TolQ/ExbB proton channel family protein [Pelovirga terrestris]|uniref:MotA/TolQ/ExbB proton channel family protein n=1 Tax=Pelovirga terrestris TaxID=2771352 RepID=A0A8J6UG57_9BACT|nr:MotA/TolQ/ExbB proton channel family protein [Pelovirga terrestris]MBD1399163.1 MotA/TolQ/ExbB proton channel family protein [Pelovirga terrestris]